MPEHWRPETPAIDTTAYLTVIANEPYVVLHFWAPWNGYDRQMDIIMRPIRAEFADPVAFFSVDVDLPEALPLCRACEAVYNVPALAFFARGQWKKTLVGLRPIGELRAFVANLITENPVVNP
jgi:thiol-disulfide isomerase/thioredoxin